MKRAGKILFCLASGLACTAVTQMADAALSNNPYAPVVARNVFGLNPPVAYVPPAAPVDPPPKITPNGILSIMGHSKVLFKVTVVKPGQPAKDEFYNLSEGQSEDNIEVTRIDEKDGLVTFNNHGTVQELPLVAGAASGGAPAGPAGAIPMSAAMANGGNGNAIPLGANGALGRRGPNLGNGGNNPIGNPGNNLGNANNSLNVSSAATRPATYGQNEQITPEVQTVMMELYREQHKDDPSFPTLPPTDLTPSDAKNPDGTPVVKSEVDQ